MNISRYGMVCSFLRNGNLITKFRIIIYFSFLKSQQSQQHQLSQQTKQKKKTHLILLTPKIWSSRLKS